MSPVSGELPDVLTGGLSILFVGINPGSRSSEVGHHYAGPSNRFWKLLFESGLIAHPMTFRDDAQLLDYGYGLTNLVARPTSSIQDLSKKDFLEGRLALVDKIVEYQPRLVALLGISVARILLPVVPSHGSGKGGRNMPIQTGLQPGFLEGAQVFVLPNPSGRNAHYSYQKMKVLFRELYAVSRQFL